MVSRWRRSAGSAAHVQRPNSEPEARDVAAAGAHQLGLAAGEVDHRGRLRRRRAAADHQVELFFQPDADFTGATYFRYASADQAGSAYQPAALAGAVPSPADDDRAEGIVREQSLASPS